MIDKEILEYLKTQLIGDSCTGAKGHEGSLQVQFGSRSLILQSSWRLIERGEIWLGSGSVELQTISRLVDRVVYSISVVNDFNDLQIKFEDESALESFADAEEFEHWSFHASKSEILIAGPGKLWSSFLQSIK